MSRCCCRWSSARGRSSSTCTTRTGVAVFAERLAQWQEKALREAKLVTDWAVPNEAYEAAARRLATSLVAEDAIPELLTEIFAFIERVAAAGAVNALAQTLLKLTVPGTPDIYQGTELWDFSLVDPDNRRPVDFRAARGRTRCGLDGRFGQDMAERAHQAGIDRPDTCVAPQQTETLRRWQLRAAGGERQACGSRHRFCASPWTRYRRSRSCRASRQHCLCGAKSDSSRMPGRIPP